MKPEFNSPPNFNRLARLYRWMEFASFGLWLWRCRCAFVHSITGCRKALVLGDGDGRFTALLLRANPEIHIDAVDASSAMLKELLSRSGSGAMRVHAFCTDARTWLPANPPYDLVVTHFFLDCLTSGEVQSLAEKIGAAVSPSALWLVSEFAVPEGRVACMAGKCIISFLYGAFGVLTGLPIRTLPDHGRALESSGFVIKQSRAWLGGLLVSEMWSVNGGN
jgi:SAM-dependent methyltransferase